MLKIINHNNFYTFRCEQAFHNIRCVRGAVFCAKAYQNSYGSDSDMMMYYDEAIILTFELT